jgi:hypothetical protein
MPEKRRTASILLVRVVVAALMLTAVRASGYYCTRLHLHAYVSKAPGMWHPAIKTTQHTR